ncbi:Gamma-glutamyl peptidase 5 [Vitis vinifera]|uniref:Gamma-glutamyl peptidase 5 n=1 Tax=Vitis vinifera TaxID=29760 RepID=A0A438I334_VITVI|nr:Gamma-glutamyl peptidase 5 [Vitis vinifera]
MVEKRFAVLLCAEDSEYVKKKYGGYYGVFVKMLGEEGEKWDVYRVALGQFPDDDEIGGYSGFVITGSCSDAHADELWICRLIDLLKKLDIMKKKVLGICFGHQGHLEQGVICDSELLREKGITAAEAMRPLVRDSILGRALGGKTGRAGSGWDIGFRTVHLSSSSSSNFFSTLKLPARLSIIECHRDEVRELPPKAEIIGWSEKTGIEMFKYGDHMMGIQGHPEYTTDILLHLIDRLLLKDLIIESFAKEVRAKVQECEADREAWRRLCVAFLKGGL